MRLFTLSWADLFRGQTRVALEAILSEYLAARRWFRSKSRERKSARIADVIHLETSADPTTLVIVEVAYSIGEAESYVLPLSLGREAAPWPAHAVVCGLSLSDGSHRVLVDGLAAGPAASVLLSAIGGRRTFIGEVGALIARPLGAFEELAAHGDLSPRPAQLEQTNSTLPLGDRMLLKVYRRLDEGSSPELEVGAFLSESPCARCAPRVVGALEYRVRGRELSTVAMVQEFVANQGTAWELTLGALAGYFERVRKWAGDPPPPGLGGSLLERAADRAPTELSSLMGSYLSSAQLLGRRTAELHLALRTGSDPAFAPERFKAADQAALYEGARALWARTCSRGAGHALAEWRDALEDRLRAVLGGAIEAERIRVHGDLHLGQVLDLGDDFLFIDFEGEPARPIAERRQKRCALVDVSGMLRSFSYAAETVLRGQGDALRLRPWAQAFADWAAAAYLGSYLRTIGDGSPLLPKGADRNRLLSFFLLEKCIYEIGYELDNRPDWVEIPLQGLRSLLEAKEGA